MAFKFLQGDGVEDTQGVSHVGGIMKAKIKFVPFSVRRRSVVFDSPTEIDCLRRRDECFAKVAKMATQASKVCLRLPREDAVPCLNDIERAHDLAIANCERLYENCRDNLPDPPDLPQRFTKPQKDIFVLAGNAFLSISGSFTAVGLGILAVVAFDPEPKPWAQSVGQFMGALGIGLVVGGGLTIAKNDDPVDKNFKKKAHPRPPNPPVLKPVLGLNQEVADAVNAVLENQARAVGIDRALMSSINRAQGAAVAKEHDFEKMQMKNAREYAGQVAQILGQSARLRRTATNKLRSSGIMLAATDDQAREMRSTIVANGIPEQIHNIIQAYGSNRQERDDIEGMFIMDLFDINALKAPFPDVMTLAGLSSAERNVASALKAFSNSTP